MRPTEFELHLNALLQPEQFHDYAPNGLQVEGTRDIARVVTGVSANQALIDAAITQDADAILVHHGFFWKNEPRTLTGIRAQRVRTLFAHDMSLFGYHLPLDAHADVGNNVGVLRAIGCTPTNTFDAGASVDGWQGAFDAPVPVEDVLARIATATDRAPQVFAGGPSTIRRVAICTGGGASFFESAAAHGADLFISGEPAEMSQGLALELGVHFVAAGHHATERFGPQALGAWASEQFGLEVHFIDIDNPV